MIYLWIVLIVVFLITEAVTYQLVSLWFAVGCIAGLITNVLGGSEALQIGVAIGVSAVSLLATRPLVKKLKFKPNATNTGLLIGNEAVVIHDIDTLNATGQVKINGQVWSAKSESNDIIKAGSCVTVDRVEGVKLVVHE